MGTTILFLGPFWSFGMRPILHGFAPVDSGQASQDDDYENSKKLGSPWVRRVVPGGCAAILRNASRPVRHARPPMLHAQSLLLILNYCFHFVLAGSCRFLNTFTEYHG